MVADEVPDQPCLAGERVEGAALAGGPPGTDQDHVLRALTLGSAVIECLSDPDPEHGRVAAAGMLFTAAAQVLTLRSL